VTLLCETFCPRSPVTGATISHEDRPCKEESKSVQALFWRLSQHKCCQDAPHVVAVYVC
jgi:hypothetical protein